MEPDFFRVIKAVKKVQESSLPPLEDLKLEGL